VPHAVVCRVVGVSGSWFYQWHHRVLTPTQQRRAGLDAAVVEALTESRGVHGSPRIHADVWDAGWRVSEKLVAASMARQGLVAWSRKRWKGLTRPDKWVVPFPEAGAAGLHRSSTEQEVGRGYDRDSR
jgi:putative transposase